MDKYPLHINDVSNYYIFVLSKQNIIIMKKSLLLVLLVALGLQTEAQITPCDSISYTITSSANTNVLQLDGVIASGFPGIVLGWEWQVCDDQMCYTVDSNQTAFFAQFNTTDTLKACLITMLDINGATYACTQCDSLVFGPNGWMLMNMGAPLAIQETVVEQINYNKIYDLLGREWTCSFANLPKGLYIINNRKILKTN